MTSPTRILEVESRSGHVLRCVSHPWFNDVHHAVPSSEDAVLVAVTGLDLVVEVTWTGNVLQEWATGGDPWERFDPDEDFRSRSSTKPHHVHPNHLFRFRNELWVTRFHQGDILCLSGERTGRRVVLAEDGIHDGVLADDTAWFTVVTGECVALNMEQLKVNSRLDLIEAGARVGWYRGILPCDGELLVGVSKLRPTRFTKNLTWVRDRLRGRQAYYSSRLLRVSSETGKILDDIELGRGCLDAIYSILPDSSEATP